MGVVWGLHERNIGEVRDSRVGKEGRKEMVPSSQNTYVTELVSNLSYCTVLWGGERVEVQSWQVWMLCLHSIHFKICGGKFQNSGQTVGHQSDGACVLRVIGGVLLQILRIDWLIYWFAFGFGVSQPRCTWALIKTDPLCPISKHGSPAALL